MQLNLPFTAVVSPEQYAVNSRSSGDPHGVVITRSHIADLLLDLAGYTSNRPLSSQCLLEPACGTGAILVQAIPRLIAATPAELRTVEHLSGTIRAYEIDVETAFLCKNRVADCLESFGFCRTSARQLAGAWVHETDFLLDPVAQTFDYVVGNPPYVRIEQLDRGLQIRYRYRYTTLYDRADLYVAFIERSLRLLSDNGVLAFICADRWTKNRYGGPLRELITTQYQLQCYLTLEDSDVFEADVSAYPTIFSVTRGVTGDVSTGTVPAGNSKSNEPNLRDKLSSVPWFSGKQPWITGHAEQLTFLRQMESQYPTLESIGDTRVGIGIATGCDNVYIVDRAADIERDRLLPLVMRADIRNGIIIGRDRCVVNVFDETGKLVALDHYPKLRSYFHQNEDVVRRRHVAKKNPKAWYRTIDNVVPGLVDSPKLLIPDIAGAAEVAYDRGGYYPHHNLYWITSSLWDLEILGGLLSSKVAMSFVAAYSTKMRGGYLRFQAQYLRRICVPRPETLNKSLQQQLRVAFRERDFMRLDTLAKQAYGITHLPQFDFVDTRK